ncbi:GntR family transcriptional regulator [Bombilactobacillus mellis]|uniref:GntR family transcriptional regulator n=1 Tax=Bombilactobacillus mellis TaxID=1218508 RepID=UPI00224760CE|nr:GntR family transcriptional regulator [Bombilactobacillus mellis]MCX0279922.1 GntR family transcriptional regulator [Bombilactobacillus mellis]
MEKKISPLNQAIENILFYIESNNLKGDNLLPSERYFSQNLNISRTTVRRALSKLIKQGKIYKKENKGYFVSPQKILRNVQDIYSTTQFFKSTNANLITKVLSINEILATKFLSRKLKLQLGTSISVLKRLRLLDGTPVILETSYIPTKFFSKISNVNFETNSLYSSFEQVGLTVEKGIETIEVVPPTDDDQLILKVNSDQKIFITRGNTFLENDEPIEYFNMKMVGKIIKFITELT